MNKVVKVTMEEGQVALLDRYAAERGVSRADIIRERIFAQVGGRRYTAKDLSALVSRTYRTSNVPRSEVERIVHAVFVEIMSESREATSPDL